GASLKPCAAADGPRAPAHSTTNASRLILSSLLACVADREGNMPGPPLSAGKPEGWSRAPSHPNRYSLPGRTASGPPPGRHPAAGGGAGPTAAPGRPPTSQAGG